MTEIIKRTDLEIGDLHLNCYAHSPETVTFSFQTYSPYFGCNIHLKKTDARAFAADILACCDALEASEALEASDVVTSAADTEAQEIF